MKLKGKLYPYQREGVRFALSHPYSIIGDMMGLGKTLQAIALACMEDSKTLIVCPAFLQNVWHNEIEKFVDGKLNYKVISYSSLKKNENLFKDIDLLILDEVHYIKNPKALRTKAIHYYVHQYKPKRLVGLTGTPIKNRVTELYSLLLLLDNHGQKRLVKPYHSYTGFCEYFSFPKIKKFNGYQVITYEGVRHEKELKEIMKDRYIRRIADDVLDLPEIVRLNVPSDKKLSEEEELELAKAWDLEDDRESISRVKAKNALIKSKFTAQYVSNLVDQGEQVVIFTDHIASAKNLAKELGKIKSVIVSGESSIDSRSHSVDLFNANKVQVFIGTIGACSVGFTLTAARHLVFNDLAWVPGDILQAEKRIHRIGQKRKCFIHKIYNSKTDYYISNMLTNKIEEIGRII